MLHNKWVCLHTLTSLLSWKRAHTHRNLALVRIWSCHAILSMSDARISLTMLLGWLSLNFRTFSTTESSVAVVSRPQKAAQSLQTMPAPMTSLPLLTVPATNGTCKSDESSSKSSTEVCGCTCMSRAEPVKWACHTAGSITFCGTLEIRAHLYKTIS